MKTSFDIATNRIFRIFLSKKTKSSSERTIIYLAVVSFIVHLLIIFFKDLGIFHINNQTRLFTNPISAIYTPFSLILIYEVYLLVYYLPQSMSTYIGKQYEIILLIIIRRLFKDLSVIDLAGSYTENSANIQFIFDLITSIVVFFLLFQFYKLKNKKFGHRKNPGELTAGIRRFILLKKIIAICLVPLLLIMAVYNFSHWTIDSIFSLTEMVNSIKDINTVFFDEFFTVLILVDVLLLLFSFLHTDKFHKVIRNSGFVISTILIRLSFGITGVLNTFLIIIAVLFGVTMLWIHNMYEKKFEDCIHTKR